MAAASPAGVVAVAGLTGVVEAVFPPFPSEAVLMLAAFTAARRGLHPPIVIAAAALGSAASLYVLYLAGRGPLRGFVRGRLRKWSAPADDQVDRFFARWGYGALFVSRFLPAVRGPLTFLAGTYGLKPAPAAAVLLIGCVIWNTLVVLIGWRAGERWDGSGSGLLGAGLLLALATAGLWGLGLLVRWGMERGARRRR
jgi:membrane protein DedA with SNARE-associated domain